MINNEDFIPGSFSDPENLVVRYDGDGSAYLKSNLFGNLVISDNYKTLILNIPTGRGFGNIFKKFSGSLQSITKEDMVYIGKSIVEERINCLKIREISASKLTSLFNSIQSFIRRSSSLNRIDFSEIKIRNLSSQEIEDIPNVLGIITNQIKSVYDIALCKVIYDKKDKEKSGVFATLDIEKLDESLLSSGSIINVDYLPRQKGIRNSSHMKLFNNQMIYIKNMINADYLDEEDKRLEILKVMNLVFRNIDEKIPDNLSMDSLKEIYSILEQKNMTNHYNSLSGQINDHYNEEGQSVSLNVVKLITEVLFKISFESLLSRYSIHDLTNQCLPRCISLTDSRRISVNS